MENQITHYYIKENEGLGQSVELIKDNDELAQIANFINSNLIENPRDVKFRIHKFDRFSLPEDADEYDANPTSTDFSESELKELQELLLLSVCKEVYFGGSEYSKDYLTLSYFLKT